MSQVEIRVRPVVRYIVTRFIPQSQGQSSVETLGEFDNEGYAEQVAAALRVEEQEHVRFRDSLGQMLGTPPAAAFEFYNPETGHAIVDYSEHTHVGRLSADRGYVKVPLMYPGGAKTVAEAVEIARKSGMDLS